jgi:hypothetical protein
VKLFKSDPHTQADYEDGYQAGLNARSASSQSFTSLDSQVEFRIRNLETHVAALMGKRELVKVTEQTMALEHLKQAVITERLELRNRMPEGKEK